MLEVELGMARFGVKGVDTGSVKRYCLEEPDRSALTLCTFLDDPDALLLKPSYNYEMDRADNQSTNYRSCHCIYQPRHHHGLPLTRLARPSTSILFPSDLRSLTGPHSEGFMKRDAMVGQLD